MVGQLENSKPTCLVFSVRFSGLFVQNLDILSRFWLAFKAEHCKAKKNSFGMFLRPNFLQNCLDFEYHLEIKQLSTPLGS